MGPTQNPYPNQAPPYAPPLGGYADPLAGAGGLSASSRQPPCPIGRSRAKIVAIRAHNGADSGAGPGILVSVDVAGAACGWRIQLGGKWPTYGIKDAKRLWAACNGLSEHDPRVTACDAPELRAMQADPTPYAGREIMIEVFENTKIDRETGRVKIDKATGKPYLTVIPSALDGAAFAPAPAAPPAPAPVPAPAAPAGPPAGWFDFPAGDPRCGVSRYNAAGETRQIGAGA